MDPKSLLKKLNKAVTEPAQERRTESVNTLKFGWHAWDKLNNRATHGVRYGMGGQYAELLRMELIFLPTLEVPKLRPKNNGFAVGKVTPFGVTAAAAVGSDVETKLQYPSQTAAMLLKAYGDKGLIILESLTAEADADKEESILLYEAVMKTVPEGQEMTGVEVIMEDLPAWLRDEAPKLLSHALKNGVTYDNVEYKLKPSARAKGLKMIAELQAGIATSNKAAITVLKKTKKELGAANKGINDSKALPDPQDEFLLYHQRSFKLDTEVERAARANESVTSAIRESSSDNTALLQQMVENNRLLAEQNRLLNQQAKSKAPAAA